MSHSMSTQRKGIYQSTMSLKKYVTPSEYLQITTSNGENLLAVGAQTGHFQCHQKTQFFKECVVVDDFKGYEFSPVKEKSLKKMRVTS